MNIPLVALVAGLCACFCQPVSAQARVLTVDNKPGAVAMFSNLEAAYSSANDGDTIVLAGSPTEYNVTNPLVLKRINYVGPGYLLEENAIPGVVKASAKLSGIQITGTSTSSSSGSTFLGLEINSLVASHSYNMAATSAAVDRCKIRTVSAEGCQLIINRSLVGGATYDEFSAGSSIRNSIVGVGSLSISNVSIGCGNVTISNCVLGYLSASQPSVSVSNSMIVTMGYGSKSAFNSAFKGSITNSLAVGFSTSTADRQSFLPDGGGNLNGYISKDVFLTTGSEDAKWQLKEGSPAIGAGYSGANAGAFGGGYVLSGIPGRPRITRLVVPATATDGTGFRFEVDAIAF
ncbi:MAG: hypothetical protein EOP84_28490 [Verrucomicrobiaceae bacterium]|nr:MAG: hypothetical protein EOP84_28490 [Verrucomicrobiaceae bacterium]